MKYQVIVGNIGVVHTGNDLIIATREFNEYETQSKLYHGRAFGEPVVLLQENGRVIREYQPQFPATKEILDGDLIACFVDGQVYCLDGCEPLDAHKVPLYRVNIGPYKQTCHKCGRILVMGRTDKWPELFPKKRTCGYCGKAALSENGACPNCGGV